MQKPRTELKKQKKLILSDDVLLMDGEYSFNRVSVIRVTLTNKKFYFEKTDLCTPNNLHLKN
jgi:hypothetical protein